MPLVPTIRLAILILVCLPGMVLVIFMSARSDYYDYKGRRMVAAQASFRLPL